MQKTLIASAMALALGASATSQAQIITITEMDFSGLSPATGTINSTTQDGQMTGSFFGHTWVADQQNWFESQTGTLTWDASGAANGGVYTFKLYENQVAAGTLFDWSTSLDIAVLTIYDCPETGGGACTGSSLPMAAGPFAGAQPGFNGTTGDDFPNNGNPIPVPAAVWLFGSGLVGLVGVARRKKKAA